jgi:DNA-binding MarR family transcriptional regulator
MGEIIKLNRGTKKREPPPLPDSARVPVRAAAGYRYYIGAPALRILIVIAAHADSEDRACVSMASLAELTGINRGNIASVINELERFGLISRERRRRPNGSSAINRYTVLQQDAAEESTGR